MHPEHHQEKENANHGIEEKHIKKYKLRPKDTRTYKTEKPKIVDKVGPSKGLDVIFNVNNDNYVYDIMETNSNSGIKFATHSPYEPPSIENDYEVVGVGKRAYVAVTLLNETYLESPWGHCSKQLEYNFQKNISKSSEFSSYSQLSCENECRKNMHKMFCGCVPYYFFNEFTVDRKDLGMNECKPIDVMSCSFKLDREIDSVINTKCDGKPLCDPWKVKNRTCNAHTECKNYCDCPSACNRISYPTRVSYITFPVLNSDRNSFKIFYRKSSRANMTGSFLRENLVGVKVYFNTLSHKVGIEMKLEWGWTKSALFFKVNG